MSVNREVCAPEPHVVLPAGNKDLLCCFLFHTCVRGPGSSGGGPDGEMDAEEQAQPAAWA